jgi:hypothetical protein
MSVLPALLRRAGLIALAAALLLWPAVLNGRPAVFTDTALYVSEAQYLTQALGLPAPRHVIVPADDPTRLPDRPGAPNLSMDIDGGRSPVWGGFLYLLQRAGGLWLFAYAQALAAALAVYLLYRAAAPRAVLWFYPVLMAGLAAVSSLPVFATLAMPDLFAGVAAVCLLTVLAYWDRLGLAKRAVTLALLAFAMMAHGSNPLLVAQSGGRGSRCWRRWSRSAACGWPISRSRRGRGRRSARRRSSARACWRMGRGDCTCAASAHQLRRA